jgi:hypothetical protein
MVSASALLQAFRIATHTMQVAVQFFDVLHHVGLTPG